MKGKKSAKRIKKETRQEQCQKCGETEVDLETMPCCRALVCWDWCLYEEPTKCPICGNPIRVTLKDEITKEAYVEVVDASENNKIEQENDCLTIYVPINQTNKKLKKVHQEFVSELVRTGWISGGDIKLKDFSGTEAEFVGLKRSLNK